MICVNEDILLITNYSLKQLNEYKKLLTRTMRLNKTEGISMHVRTQKVNGIQHHVLKIRNGNKKAEIILVAIDLMCINDIDDYSELNEKAEKMLLKEEWFYGLKDRAGLEQVIGSMNQSVFGHTLHPTVVDKAVHLWYSIATKQMFNNGNKRTALLAAVTMLNLNFLELPNMDPMELYNISLKLARKEMSPEQLKNFLMTHLIVSTKYMNLFLDQAQQVYNEQVVDK